MRRKSTNCELNNQSQNLLEYYIRRLIFIFPILKNCISFALVMATIPAQLARYLCIKEPDWRDYTSCSTTLKTSSIIIKVTYIIRYDFIYTHHLKQNVEIVILNPVHQKTLSFTYLNIVLIATLMYHFNKIMMIFLSGLGVN